MSRIVPGGPCGRKKNPVGAVGNLGGPKINPVGPMGNPVGAMGGPWDFVDTPKWRAGNPGMLKNALVFSVDLPGGPLVELSPARVTLLWKWW